MEHGIKGRKDLKVNLCIYIGIYYYNDGNKYDGELANDMKNGYGILYISVGVFDYNNGDKYDGNWINDVKSGNGKGYFYL